MPSPLPVLIVGAGPVGLTTALLLAKQRIPIRIIEKNFERNHGTRGAGLMPRTLELYQLLGCMPEMIKHQCLATAPMLSYKIPGGTEVAREMPPIMGELSEDQSRPYNEMWFIPQEDQEDVLRHELEKYGYYVEFGKELESLNQLDDQVVAKIIVLSKEGETTTTSEEIKALYLVGSDGGKSVVRKLLDFSFLGTQMEADGMITVNATVSSLRADVGHVWRFPDGIFIGYKPYITESKKFVIYLMGRNDLEEHATPDGIRKLLKTTIGREDIIPDEYDWISYYSPSIRLVDRFSKGRIFLAGDSAHVHPPHGGQGLNSGIQDAFNLAWKLGLVIKGQSSPTLLETYNEERLPVLTEMLRQVLGLYQNFQVDTSIISSGNRQLSKEEQWMMMGINYRWSSIILDCRSSSSLNHDLDSQESVSEEESLAHAHGDVDVDVLKSRAYNGWGGELRAGDRVPDAKGLQDLEGKSFTLYKLLSSTRHTLLIFTGRGKTGMEYTNLNFGSWPDETLDIYIITTTPSETTGHQPQDLGSVKPILDKENGAHKAYHVDVESVEPLFVVIRPDHFIGFVGRTVEELNRYKSLIFTLTK